MNTVSIAAADINNDGMLDMLVGNWNYIKKLMIEYTSGRRSIAFSKFPSPLPISV